MASSPANPAVTATPAAHVVPRRARPGVGLGLLAVVLASVAVNRLQGRVTPAAPAGARQIASVGAEFERDAAWEKSLAERLARPRSVNGPAGVGRAPSLAESLRYNDLQNAYAVKWSASGRRIESIALAGEPVLINGQSFLSKYGTMFEPAFASAERVGVEDGAEIFALRDHAGKDLIRARLELDQEHRLRALRLISM